jgi:hypothetical protein
MNDFIKVSGYINKLLGDFGEYFDHALLARTERQQIETISNHLHRKLLGGHDLMAYDEQLELAERTYSKMLFKMNNQQLVEDILFCGSSELSWEEISRTLSDLYRRDLSSKEIYIFYCLHEIKNKTFIDSPLPARTA